MKSAELHEKCKKITNDLIEEIKSEKFNISDYLDFCSKFHNYSFRNKLLIWSCKPGATHVAGFRTWQKMDRRVIKGEKGIPIFAPLIWKQKKELESEVEEDEELEEVRLFKVVYVWDVSQTEGKDVPQAPDVVSVQGDAGILLPILEQVLQSHGIVLKYSSRLGSGVQGVSKIGEIEILDSVSDPEKFRIALHEFSHELLHGKQERKNFSKKVKEMEADATAYVVSHHFGLKTKAPAYLAMHEVEEVDVLESLDRIASTASLIITNIEKHRVRNIKKAA
jgi:hypothetical protein